MQGMFAQAILKEILHDSLLGKKIKQRINNSTQQLTL